MTAQEWIEVAPGDFWLADAPEGEDRPPVAPREKIGEDELADWYSDWSAEE
jgi:hypothetical protein